MDIKQLKYEIEQKRKHIAATEANLEKYRADLEQDEARLKELENPQPWQPEEGEMAWFLNGSNLPQRSEIRGFYDRATASIGLACQTEADILARRDFLQLLTRHNLWERVQQEVTLRLELEAYAKEHAMRSNSVVAELYSKEFHGMYARLQAHFGDRLNILFQPLTPQDHV